MAYDVWNMTILVDKYVDVLARESMREPLQACAPIVRRGISANFLGGTSPEGDPWPPRKDPSQNHPLLILSGALKAAASQEGAPGHVEDFGDREMAIGVDKSKIVYAGVQNFGWPERNIAQRKYMGLGESSLIECRMVISREIFVMLNGVI